MSALIAGTSLVPFVKPGQSETYDKMGADALSLALIDAGISLKHLDQAYVGYVYGDSTSGQRAVYRVGTTGIPVTNQKQSKRTSPGDIRQVRMTEKRLQ